MADAKMLRLSQVAKKLNVGTATIVDHLAAKGFKLDSNPNSKITEEQMDILAKDFKYSMVEKQEAQDLTISKNRDTIIDSSEKKEDREGNDYSNDNKEKSDNSKSFFKNKQKKRDEMPLIKGQLPGLTVIDKIDLDARNRSKQDVTTPLKKTSEPITNSTKEVSEPLKSEPLKEVMPVIQASPKNIAENDKNIIEKQGNEKSPIKPETPQKEIVIKTDPVLNTGDDKQNTALPPVNQTPSVEKSLNEKVTDANANKNQSIKTNPGQDEMPINKPEPGLKKANVQQEQQMNPEKDTNPKDSEENNKAAAENEGNGVIHAKADKLQGLKVIGKIELPVKNAKKKPKPVASSDEKKGKKRKRKRLKVASSTDSTFTDDKTAGTTTPPTVVNKPKTENRPVLTPKPVPREIVFKTHENRNAGGGNSGTATGGGNPGGSGNSVNRNQNQNQKKVVKPVAKETVSEKQIQDKLKATLAKIGGKGGTVKKTTRTQRRRMKGEGDGVQEDLTLLKVTEFISTNELASLMEVSVNEIIAKCLEMGMFIGINQRLDAETINFIADEFGFTVEFNSAEEEIDLALDQLDSEEDMVYRAPIVTIMGHVDHGKTSLLDYIRKTKVMEGEAGGITQHIGAYDVITSSGKRIVFLDTPGHEAFTAMRARGAKVTDVAIIVIAADDSVMPQTEEAINHAQLANVPIVFAINKVDREGANPEKIKEQLAKRNILVEDWGGKYQSHEISAKKGIGIDDLLEKVVLESEMLDLKANPNKRAVGTVIEASLDKGKGYVTTVLVQAGELKVGDAILAGAHYGKVKAMTNHLGKKLQKVGPSTPVQVLGLDGAPQAGDKFNAVETEREAREVANRRAQILREQTIRATRRTTLNDIGKRIALGSFQQLNIIVKGDVDGSVEALSDSLLKLSTEEIKVNIIHKAVGPISESDILLASASDAIVIGFQVRPSPSTKKLAIQEQIEIRLYSIIYDTINDVKSAMEGMLAPKIEEHIVGNVQIRDVFKISKIGVVAGCYVTEGYVKRSSKIRVIRDGIVIHGGERGGSIAALKRFKDDVFEVKQSFECGISIRDFNDLKMDDVIEVFEEKEVKRTL